MGIARKLGVVVALAATLLVVGEGQGPAGARPAPDRGAGDCDDPDTTTCVRVDPDSGPVGTEVTVRAMAGACFPEDSAAQVIFTPDPTGIDDPDLSDGTEIGTVLPGDVFEEQFVIPDDATYGGFFVRCGDSELGGLANTSFQIERPSGPDPDPGAVPGGVSQFGGDNLEVSPDDGGSGDVTVTALEIGCGGESVVEWFPEYRALGPTAPGSGFEGRGDAVELGRIRDGEQGDFDFEIPDGAPDTSAFAMTCMPQGGVHAWAIVGDAVYDPTFVPEPQAGPGGLIPAGFKPPHDRAALPASVPAPDDVSTDGGLLLTNLLIALIMLLLVFPAELFNATFEEHYDEVAGWLRGPRRLLERANALVAQRGAQTGFLAVTGATAVLYAFLDPNVSLDEATLAMVLGVGGAIAAGVLVGGWASRRYLGERHGDEGSLTVYPAALFVALVCVVISRIADFQPGYLYGIVAGFAFTAQLSRDDEGKVSAFAAAAGLAASVVAWILWIPVRDSAGDADPNIVVLALDSFLATMFVGGLQALVFGFVPIRFLPGAKVWAWSKRIWALLFGIGCFGFIHTMVNASNEEGYDGDLPTVIGLFVAFAAASGAFWAYFRYRTTDEPQHDDVLADA